MRQAGSAERSARRAGPRPSRVHARATGNARRHGLTVPIRLDPRWRAAVVALERTLVREAPTARAFAGRAAEGVVELRRIAQARAAFIGAFEGEATLDLLRRLDRYESLAYAKKDKALRVIAAHRLVRDCAEALRCCSKVAIRKSSVCGELRDPEAFDTAVRPASGGDELGDRARRPRHPAHPRPPRGAQRHGTGERGGGSPTRPSRSVLTSGSRWRYRGARAFCAGFDLKYAAGLKASAGRSSRSTFRKAMARCRAARWGPHGLRCRSRRFAAVPRPDGKPGPHRDRRAVRGAVAEARPARRGDHARLAPQRPRHPLGRAEPCTRDVGRRPHLRDLVGPFCIPRNRGRVGAGCARSRSSHRCAGLKRDGFTLSRHARA
jgi:hypothetical protein